MASSTASNSKIVTFLLSGPGFQLVRVVLFLIGTGLGIFDTYTDWQLVIRFRENGFNHPLLPIDINWLRAWYLFATIGTILTAITLTNESIDILHSLSLVYKKYGGCKSWKSRKDTKMNGKSQVTVNEHINFEMIRQKAALHTNHAAMKEDQDREKQGEKDDDSEETMIINDACRCCYRCGWNFTTRAETLGKLSLWFQDVPMLTLSMLYAFSQTSCKLPEKRDVSGDLYNVGLSAVASFVAVAFRLARSVLRLCISLGLRIKSKKDASKMGRIGKCFAIFLPENGDALYPQRTCAQCCIFPFFFSIILDFVLLFMGFIITLIIWVSYFSLKRTPNFDDSLAIYRITYEGNNVHLLNISNNIIPASNGTFVGFETVYDGKDVTHCLSEFQYREEDFDIFFNTIEVVAVSDKGEFCATKSGDDLDNFDAYSRCTLYYTYKGYVLYYGFTDRITGKITRFDSLCIVVKDRFPKSSAGPDPDRSIRVEDNIRHIQPLPRSNKGLLILYVTPDPTNRIALFTISVDDLVQRYLDATYVGRVQQQSNGTNVTYLVRVKYDLFKGQFTYNIKEVLNYPPPFSQRCLCSDAVNSSRKFHQNGQLVYGYYNPKTGRFPLLWTCSQIPVDKVVPQYNPSLFVGCFC